MLPCKFSYIISQQNRCSKFIRYEANAQIRWPLCQVSSLLHPRCLPDHGGLCPASSNGDTGAAVFPVGRCRFYNGCRSSHCCTTLCVTLSLHKQKASASPILLLLLERCFIWVYGFACKTPYFASLQKAAFLPGDSFETSFSFCALNLMEKRGLFCAE